MKAVVSARYGPPDILEINEVPKPEPNTGEVLIRVHATTVSRTDDGMLRPHPFFARLFTGLFKPKRKILGMDFSGEIEAIGEDVKTFKPGDHVFGMSPDEFGAHAEFLCIPESGAIAIMPTDASFIEVVACEGVWYANTYLKAFNLKPGKRILIYGASGAIGTAAVQLAKFYGAEVTAVVATRHRNLAKSLGADRVIDYTAEKFTEIGETFDFVLDAVGKTTYFHCRKLLDPDGVFAATDLGPWCQNILLTIWFSITKSRTVVSPMPKNARESVDLLGAMLETEQFRAVVDREYPLDAIVDAYRYVETEQKTGIVVVNVISGDKT